MPSLVGSEMCIRDSNAVAQRSYEFEHLKASVTLLIPNLLVMRSQTLSRRGDVSPYLTVNCAQEPVRKFQERLPTGCLSLIKLFLFPLSAYILCILCLCIEVWPSHTTHAQPISAATAPVVAPIYALHPPLPASKTGWSSWSLVVICPLIDTGDTVITETYHPVPHCCMCTII